MATFLTCHYVIFTCLALLVASQTTCGPETDTIRTFDGSCNHQADVDRGTPHTPYYRTKEGAFYENGFDTPRVSPITTREASNRLSTIETTPKSAKTAKGLSLFHTFFGQFISHDMALTESLPTNPAGPPDPVNNILIPVADDDPLLFFFGQPKTILPFIGKFLRTGVTVATNDSNGVRQPLNMQTHWMDMSNIYWNDIEFLNKQRTFSDGLLLLSDHKYTSTWNPNDLSDLTSDPETRKLLGVLPLKSQINTPSDAFNEPDDVILVSGDRRAGENMGLLTIHTMFHQEHNRIAKNLKAQHPQWNDEQLFQKARIVNTAQYQHIVYNEYLPLLMGDLQIARYLGRWNGYKAGVDGRMSPLFSFAAGRYGHSTVFDSISLFDDCRNKDLKKGFNGIIGLRTVFPLRAIMGAGGHTDVARTMSYTQLEEFDHLVHNTLRNINFGPVLIGQDVLTLNMQRARHEGVPDFNTVYDSWNGLMPEPGRLYSRNGCSSSPSSPGLDSLGCWDSWISNDTLSDETRSAYQKLIHIDAWMGFMSEKKAPGSNLGRTAARVILDQYRRSRDGDRFWFENQPNLGVSTLLGELPLSQAEVDQIKTVTLEGLVRTHFPGYNLAGTPFMAAAPDDDIFDNCAATTRLSLVDKDGNTLDDILSSGNEIDLRADPLREGDQIVAQTIGTVSSVKFTISGPFPTFEVIDNSAPYSFPVSAISPSSGCQAFAHPQCVTIVATPFTGSDATGDEKFPVTIPITLVGNQSFAVTGLRLWDTDSNTELGSICDGAVIDLSVNPEVSIEALVTPSVDSVVFYLGGAVEKIENDAGYFIAGRSGTDPNMWNITPGDYVLRAVPFNNDGSGGQLPTGNAGLAVEIHFTVVS